MLNSDITKHSSVLGKKRILNVVHDDRLTFLLSRKHRLWSRQHKWWWEARHIGSWHWGGCNWTWRKTLLIKTLDWRFYPSLCCFLIVGESSELQSSIQTFRCFILSLSESKSGVVLPWKKKKIRQNYLRRKGLW